MMRGMPVTENSEILRIASISEVVDFPEVFDMLFKGVLSKGKFTPQSEHPRILISNLSTLLILGFFFMCLFYPQVFGFKTEWAVDYKKMSRVRNLRARLFL